MYLFILDPYTLSTCSAPLSTVQGTERNVTNLTLVKLEKCSHWAQQDRHELVTTKLREFFAAGTSPVRPKSQAGAAVDVVAMSARRAN